MIEVVVDFEQYHIINNKLELKKFIFCYFDELFLEMIFSGKKGMCCG